MVMLLGDSLDFVPVLLLCLTSEPDPDLVNRKSSSPAGVVGKVRMMPSQNRT